MSEKPGGTMIAPEIPQNKPNKTERTDHDVATDLAAQMFNDSIKWKFNSEEQRAVIEELIKIARGDKREGTNSDLSIDLLEQNLRSFRLRLPPEDQRVIEGLIKLARKKE